MLRARAGGPLHRSRARGAASRRRRGKTRRRSRAPPAAERGAASRGGGREACGGGRPPSLCGTRARSQRFASASPASSAVPRGGRGRGGGRLAHPLLTVTTRSQVAINGRRRALPRITAAGPPAHPLRGSMFMFDTVLIFLPYTCARSERAGECGWVRRAWGGAVVGGSRGGGGRVGCSTRPSRALFAFLPPVSCPSPRPLPPPPPPLPPPRVRQSALGVLESAPRVRKCGARSERPPAAPSPSRA